MLGSRPDRLSAGCFLAAEPLVQLVGVGGRGSPARTTRNRQAPSPSDSIEVRSAGSLPVSAMLLSSPKPWGKCPVTDMPEASNLERPNEGDLSPR